MMSNCYSFSPSPVYLNFSHRRRFRHTLFPSAVRRRHHRRPLLKYYPNHNLTSTPTPAIFKLSDNALQITLKPPSNPLQQLETRLNQFLGYGREAFDDLGTVVTVNGNSGGLVISCRRSTVEFLIGLFLTSFIVVIAFRGLFEARKSSGEVLVYKRDRSMGGREVLVGKRETNWSMTSRKSTPLSSDINYYHRMKKNRRTTLGRRRKEELPQWWPQAVNWDPQKTDNKEEHQKMANQLIRAIMDRKISGQDISTNDIIQLRNLCKTYGVRAFIDPENARDSLYRASVKFVLDYCESISNDTTSIQINGEDIREFIAGLADNIGLEYPHAARMVTAAVAARTRSRILQSWALEVQNKHAEALVELFKVCRIHRIFPPEENSPEMEMVARGLDKSLSLEQREYIMNSFITICGNDIDQSVVEALGLLSRTICPGPPGIVHNSSIICIPVSPFHTAFSRSSNTFKFKSYYLVCSYREEAQVNWGISMHKLENTHMLLNRRGWPVYIIRIRFGRKHRNMKRKQKKGLSIQGKSVLKTDASIGGCKYSRHALNKYCLNVCRGCDVALQLWKGQLNPLS